ncbi:Uncharacterized protein TCM_006455 [Theobroma cacao]|uniref:Uncharacterized protein n=1 Tax=Theobroma cacao TaxID=3641 RepID=A0A061DYE8_THECC|nr:Uncharacterized protein TCM_006455 [Theobroma cacao]
MQYKAICITVILSSSVLFGGLLLGGVLLESIISVYAREESSPQGNMRTHINSQSDFLIPESFFALHPKGECVKGNRTKHETNKKMKKKTKN